MCRSVREALPCADCDCKDVPHEVDVQVYASSEVDRLSASWEVDVPVYASWEAVQVYASSEVDVQVCASSSREVGMPRCACLEVGQECVECA